MDRPRYKLVLRFFQLLCGYTGVLDLFQFRKKSGLEVWRQRRRRLKVLLDDPHQNRSLGAPLRGVHLSPDIHANDRLAKI